MEKLLFDLLKVSAGTSLFYSLYLMFFRKDTFYLRNRIFLILTLVLPTLIPLLKIPVMSTMAAAPSPDNLFASPVFSGSVSGPIMAGSVDSFDYYRLFAAIYFTVAALLLLRIVVSVFSTYRIIKNGVVKSNQFPKIIISAKHLPPFSFFPYAVLPDEEYNGGKYNDIVDHEFAHIRQGHTFDLLLGELFIAFQWFNPFVWLIKRSIILNHEYLAARVSLRNNQSTLEYQYRLLNFQTGLKNVSLAHNFNSLIKNRIIMINKKPTRKYAILKNILILPVVAFVMYAFATPEYRYPTYSTNDKTFNIYESPVIFQKEVNGIVVNEAGKPLNGVNITSTGTIGNAHGASTGSDGRFTNVNVQVGTKAVPPAAQRPNPIVVIDGKISDMKISDVRTSLGYNMGPVMMINGKEATDKYGEKGVNGVYEITTRKKALEMGLKPPFPRLAPQDYPTFQNQPFNTFSKWVASQVKYPAEARSGNIEGWVTVNLTVDLKGIISDVASSGLTDKILSDEVVRVIKSSPKWEPAKNPNVDEPWRFSVTLKFKLPDQILDEAPFVVVQKMPDYPGGDVELLNFIKNNIRYPEKAKADGIEGKVIIRFIINPDGGVEGLTVLKSINPLLDAEALRVVSMLKGFTPGTQAGKAVYVNYQVPVNFSLRATEPLFSEQSERELLWFIGRNTVYPEEAKNTLDTATIFVTVKISKGGVIQECKASTEKVGISVPLLPEVVIIALGKEGISNKSLSNEHPLLKTEALRVVNTLGELNIPELKEKNMEFAIALKFVLR
jgi:TonB family protein